MSRVFAALTAVGAAVLTLGVVAASSGQAHSAISYKVKARYALHVGKTAVLGKGFLLLYRDRRFIASFTGTQECHTTGGSDPGTSVKQAGVMFRGRMAAGSHKLHFAKVTRHTYPTGDGNPDGTSSRDEEFDALLSRDGRKLKGTFARDDEVDSLGVAGVADDYHQTCFFQVRSEVFRGRNTSK